MANPIISSSPETDIASAHGPMGSGIPSMWHKAAWVAAGAATFICLLWNADVPALLGLAFMDEQFLALMLGLALFSVFLTARFSRKREIVGPPPIFDRVIAITALLVLLYTSINYPTLVEQISARPPVLTVIGLVVVLTVLEGLRRLSGWVLFVVILIFIAYALMAHLVPGRLVGRQAELVNLVQYIGFQPSAVFGTPLKVGATVVVLFVFMGKLLFATGGGKFFTDLALAVTGRMRGGSAKISVVASALFGSISGSAVSNVATTGLITIPLMRRGGYSAVNAGAIEAIASTGGQLMPPIMGAAAFLIAEFLEVPYIDVMIAALIPAALYYISVFLQVDLVAARDGISTVDEEVPRARQILKNGWQFALPLLVLLYALFWMGADAEIAALYACASIVIVGIVKPYGVPKLSFRDIVRCLAETGIATMELILIVAAAGFVIGILNITGLGFALTLELVRTAGNELFIVLLAAAVICIILGMGMPTSGVYVLLAALVAPALIEAGAEPMSAHLFILYFGMMSMITPPIALAAVAAAALTRADAMRTGFAAVKFGWIAYLVPFLFVFNPALLLTGEVVTILWAIGKVLVGIYLVTIAIVGYYRRRLPIAIRVFFAVAGMLAILSLGPLPRAELLGPAGLALGLLLIASTLVFAKKREEAG